MLDGDLWARAAGSIEVRGATGVHSDCMCVYMLGCCWRLSDWPAAGPLPALPVGRERRSCQPGSRNYRPLTTPPSLSSSLPSRRRPAQAYSDRSTLKARLQAHPEFPREPRLPVVMEMHQAQGQEEEEPQPQPEPENENENEEALLYEPAPWATVPLPQQQPPPPQQQPQVGRRRLPLQMVVPPFFALVSE